MGNKRGPQIAVADMLKVMAIAQERSITIDAAALVFVQERQAAQTESRDWESISASAQLAIDADLLERGYYHILAVYEKECEEPNITFGYLQGIEDAVLSPTIESLDSDAKVRAMVNRSFITESQQRMRVRPSIGFTHRAPIVKSEEAKAKGNASGIIPLHNFSDEKYRNEFDAVTQAYTLKGSPLNQKEFGIAIKGINGNWTEKDGSPREKFNWSNELSLSKFAERTYSQKEQDANDSMIESARESKVTNHPVLDAVNAANQIAA